MEKISINIVNNYLGITEESDKRDILIFGVQRVLEDITKIIIILIIAMILNIVTEVLLVFSLMMIYKNFLGGAHAKTNIICTIVSTLECLGPIYFAKYIMLDTKSLYYLSIATIIFSIYCIIKHAPSDTENIPKINIKQRHVLKILAFITCLIIIFAFLFIFKNNYYSTIALVILNLSNLNTTDIMYKIAGCKRGYESMQTMIK